MSTDAIEALGFFLAVSSVSWAAVYAWGKWLAHRPATPDSPAVPPSVDPERIARLELAVEAMAMELERVGEAQRYTVKLLEERLPLSLPRGDSASSR